MTRKQLNTLIALDRALILAFDLGKARDSKGFAKLYLKANANYSELLAAYRAGLHA